jgi:hypothetical protein
MKKQELILLRTMKQRKYQPVQLTAVALKADQEVNRWLSRLGDLNEYASTLQTVLTNHIFSGSQPIISRIADLSIP